MIALPPDAEVGDRTLAKWSALWWKWAFAFPVIPVNDNPGFDPNPNVNNSARFGDVGPVFFLAGAFPGAPPHVERTATIPANKFIFFPVLAVVNDNVQNSTTSSISQLYAELAGLIETVTELHASLDGVPVPGLRNHRVISPVFSYTLQLNNNVIQHLTGNMNAVGTVFPVVADGFYLMLPPLAPGPHVINFGGSAPGFSININYNINVTHAEVEQPAVMVP